MGRPTDYTLAPNIGEAKARKPAVFFAATLTNLVDKLLTEMRSSTIA
jgi:hypothetical protein